MQIFEPLSMSIDWEFFQIGDGDRMRLLSEKNLLSPWVILLLVQDWELLFSSLQGLRSRGSLRSPPGKWQITFLRSWDYFNLSTRELAQLQPILNSKQESSGHVVFLSYWGLFVSRSLYGIDSRSINQPDGVDQEQSREARSDLQSWSGHLTLPASDQMVLWTLKEQEWVSLGMMLPFPTPLPSQSLGVCPAG